MGLKRLHHEIENASSRFMLKARLKKIEHLYFNSNKKFKRRFDDRISVKYNIKPWRIFSSRLLLVNVTVDCFELYEEIDGKIAPIYPKNTTQ